MRRSRYTGTGRPGFTLVELLVAIAIIAVIASILLVVFPRTREMARRTACVSNCKQLLAAARMYAHDHDQRLAPAITRGAPVPDKGYTWCVTLQPYIKNEQVLICPSDQEAQATPGFVCLPHSYGMNYRLTYNTAFGLSPGALTSKLTTSHQHSSLILIFEMDSKASDPGGSYVWHRLSRVRPRHGERATFGFLDGHADTLLPEETVQPENMWE